MGSALLNSTPRRATGLETPPDAPQDATENLRRVAADRLAAHRSRRTRIVPPPPPQQTTQSAAPPPENARIAAAVAQRYAAAQTYRAFLQAEAERAVQQARAAAEIAACNARAIAAAQQQLLEELQRHQQIEERADSAPLDAAPSNPSAPALFPEWHASEAPHSPPPSRIHHPRPRPSPRAPQPPDGTTTPLPEPPALRVLLYTGDHTPPLARASAPRRSSSTSPDPRDPEALALDEEICFRQAPVFEEPPGPPVALPANLIEFPRQLVASRKARPRHAEGPLRGEEHPAETTAQLRIFEVEPAQISITPPFAAPEPPDAAQWTSLWLDTPAGALSSNLAQNAAAPSVHPAHLPPSEVPGVRLHPAPPARRLRAAAIDLALTSLGLVFACAGFVAATGAAAAPHWTLAAVFAASAHSLAGAPAAPSLWTAAALFGVLFLAYQLLFFTWSWATPGMRLARIGLCTFSDDNPTRAAMRRRIAALVLSVGTLGFGLLWALLDEDGLTWHDLISRMYQRSY